MIEIKEILRRWAAGEGIKSVARVDGLGEDQLGGGSGMGATDIEPGLALGVVEGEGEAVLAGPGLKRARSPAGLDEPALESLPVEGARRVAAWRAVAALGAQLELVSELAVGDACICDGCVTDQELCLQHPMDRDACIAIDTCADEQTCGDVWCGFGSRCDADTTTCVLGDLAIDAATVESTFAQQLDFQPRASCEEECITGTGTRRLLRFTAPIENVGAGDIYLGDPYEIIDGFIINACQQTEIRYETSHSFALMDGNVTVVEGNTFGACIGDGARVGADAAVDPLYSCTDNGGPGNIMGIQAGWSTNNLGNQPCSWLDITDVDPGDYTVRFELNTDESIAEADYDNNVIDIPFTVTVP